MFKQQQQQRRDGYNKHKYINSNTFHNTTCLLPSLPIFN